jgi:hypothetical protein
MTDIGVRPGAEGELPPVQAIERAVQERAKDLQLDMGVPAGRQRLRDLIDDEIEAWADDVRRGRRTQPLTNVELVADRVWRNLAEHGPLTSLLADPDVWEIEVNAPDQVFVKRHHGPSGYHHESFHDDDHVVRALTKLLDESSASHRKLDPTEGLQDAQLDDGSRLHIVHADVARGGHVMVNIRRFTGVPFTRLEELVERDTIDATVARFLSTAVRAGASIVVAGAPGSGKTTLLSCCIGELDPSLRVVIAEEVFEVDAPLGAVCSPRTAGDIRPRCVVSAYHRPCGNTSSRAPSAEPTSDGRQKRKVYGSSHLRGDRSAALDAHGRHVDRVGHLAGRSASRRSIRLGCNSLPDQASRASLEEDQPLPHPRLHRRVLRFRGSAERKHN